MKTSAFVSWAVALGAALSFSLAEAAAADAEGAPPAVDKLAASAKSRLWICGLYARAALVHLDARREAESQSALEELVAKIRESKDNFSESYVALRSQLAGDSSREATDALNDYAASVLAAYDESAIRAGETQASYDRRTADLDAELSAKAEGFKRRLLAKAQLAPPQPAAQATVQAPVPVAAQAPASAAAQIAPVAAQAVAKVTAQPAAVAQAAATAAPATPKASQ